MNNKIICSYCNKEISHGKYLRDFWGNNYHLKHKNRVPECPYCGRLTTNCKSCNRDRIDSLDQVKPLYTMVSNLLAKYGFDIRSYKTEIYLLEPKGNQQSNREEPGYIKVNMKKVNGLVKEISFKVFIQKGLPKTYFLSTLAHEMMHQWIILFGHPNIQPVLNEGASNYSSYLLLKEIETPLSYYIIETMMKDNHPHYGRGFRKVLKYVERRGHHSFIEYLKKNRRI